MTVWERKNLLPLQRSKKLYACVLIAFAVLSFAVVQIASPVYAQTVPNNKVISFSARLKKSDGTTVPDGFYNVSFRLYDTNESGTPLWAESYYDENGDNSGQDYRIRVVNGYLNAKLGSRTVFPKSINWNGNLWLTMNIGGTEQIGSLTNIPWDGEMTPRIQLNAVPYAMSAGLLDGKAAGDFVQLGQGVQTNSSDNPSIHINTTGSGNLVQLQKNAEDVFTVDSEGNILFGGISDHKISIDQSDENTDGRTLVIEGGDGGEGSTNGGNVVIKGGNGNGDGADGLVVLSNATFATTTDDLNCYTGGAPVPSSCSITQSTIDSSSAVMIGFSTAGQKATLPDPTIKTAGRILYIMSAKDSQSLSLIMNGDQEMEMQPNAALTLLWNGSDWIIAGQIGVSNNVPPLPEISDDEIPAVTDVTIEEGESDQEIEIENVESTPSPSGSEQSSDSNSLFPFQLQPLESAPMASPGTMYYDTTLGKVQCYEEAGWGPCGDAPDTFVAISPEYKNAVMNGTDIGIISSDFCSGSLGINDGSDDQPIVCAPTETYNFYRWTSQEEDNQTRSIYLTYQLPENFKSFIGGSTSIMGRTDSDDAKVEYQIYRDDGNGLIACGEPITISTGEQTNWQKGLATDKDDPEACDFEAGDSMLFRINLTSKKKANAYVSNVNFIFRNN